MFGCFSNSFFAKKLALSSFALVVLNALGLVGYYMNFQNIQFAAKQSAGCENTSANALLVYRGAVVTIVLGLPSTGIRIFDIFSRDENEDKVNHRKHNKLNRTLYLQFCEVVAVLVILYLVFLSLYLMFTIQTSVFRCTDLKIWGFVINATVVFCLIFVQVTYFARFREHLKMQLGVFKEKDQTGNIRSRYKKNGRKPVKRVAIVNDIRKRIYTAVELRDKSTIESVVREAQQHFGEDFVDELYASPKIRFWLFAKSVKNPMHLAAYMGDINTLNLLFDAGFDINAYDKFFRVRFSTGDVFWYFLQFFVRRQGLENGDKSSIFLTTLLTPLHCATSSGRIDVVRWLIARNANVNAFAKSSYRSERITPIFLVDNAVICEDLLQAGANHLLVPDPGYRNTITALELAYLKGNFGVAQTIEQWGGDIALTPLHAAAASNNISQVKKLLKRKADPNCRGEHGYIGVNRRTPLHWAATMGCYEAAMTLLKGKALTNCADSGGRTPLHWAARHNEVHVVELLLEYGADASIQDGREMTPITCAAHGKCINKEIFLALVKAGADLNYQLPNGDTAMHVAMKLENRQTALALLEIGADIMVTNADGFRPVDCTTSTELQFAVKKAAGTRDVMISYTHSHSEFALKLQASLERANVTTWIDSMTPAGIGGGSVWREEIAKGIANAALVLAIVTADYPKSEWCLKEVAYAKLIGIPVLGISLENAEITDELQVYLYTRQLVPFEKAITRINNRNHRKITFQYNDVKYDLQFRLLLDGIRDEIEKRRLGRMNPEKNADMTLNLLTQSLGDGKFIFLSHGNHHAYFVRSIWAKLNAIGIKCYVDPMSKSDSEDIATHVNASKDAILKCSCFMVILSNESSESEVLNDQLAFAEDKGKPIFPILLSEPRLGPGQQYTLSTYDIYHFSSGIGFSTSFRYLVQGIRQEFRDNATSFNHDNLDDFENDMPLIGSPLMLSFASSDGHLRI